jgi:hypothetical protein
MYNAALRGPKPCCCDISYPLAIGLSGVYHTYNHRKEPT